jgi:hypothetical protein
MEKKMFHEFFFHEIRVLGTVRGGYARLISSTQMCLVLQTLSV